MSRRTRARAKYSTGGEPLPDINLWDVLHRKRFALGPFYVGVLVAIAAGLGALLDPYAALAVEAAVAAAVAVWAQTRIRDKRRRSYAFVVTAAALGWLVLARLLFPLGADWFVVTLLGGTLLLGLPWWTSQRKRTQVHIEEELEDWPNVARRMGFAKINKPTVTVTPIGRKGVFTWAPGEYNVTTVLKAREDIEGALDADHGTLRLERNGKSTNSVKWMIVEKDPHAEPQPWVPPTQLRDSAEPSVIGPREDGQLVSVQRFVRGKGVRHALIAGASESGKSSLVNVCVAEDACDPDVFPIGMDFKQVELLPWKPSMGWMTTNTDQAERFFRAITQPGGLLDERGQILADAGDRVWDPKKHGPIISITVDEMKRLMGNANAKLIDAHSNVANLGRALGIRLTEATQYPTVEAVGSTQIREQMALRFCFRMNSDDGEAFIMPGEVIRADLISSDRQGTCYVKEGSNLTKMPVRVFYLDDDMVRSVAYSCAEYVPELDQRSYDAIVAFFPEFVENYRPGLDGTAGTDGYDEIGGDDEEDWDQETGTGDRGPAGDYDGDRDKFGPGTGDDDEEDELTRIEIQDGPDLPLAELAQSRRDRLSESERARQDVERDRLLAELPQQRLGEEEAREALLRALAEAGPDGTSAAELQRAADRKSSWFYDLAAKLAEEGVIERVHRGKWALVPEKLTLVHSASSSGDEE